MKVTVLGAGAWGTALARLIHLGGHPVTLWAHNPDRLEQIRRTHRNTRYLPQIDLPRDWSMEPDIHKAAKGAEVLVVAVASKAFRKVAQEMAGFRGLVLSLTKGIEFDTNLTMSGILKEVMPQARIGALSGPNLALEIARDIPAASVVGSQDPGTATALQELVHRPAFRVYTSDDLIGVELGGALKNVIAIAAGVGDGLGFGDNSKASLITRAIVEIQRLGVACGARPETFAGLSGLGDLTVTCFSKLSRNRNFGERLGRGDQITHILLDTPNVAEGYPTACSAHQLAQRRKVDTPIINEVYEMLYNGKDVSQAVSDLMTRESRPETEI